MNIILIISVQSIYLLYVQQIHHKTLLTNSNMQNNEKILFKYEKIHIESYSNFVILTFIKNKNRYKNI